MKFYVFFMLSILLMSMAEHAGKYPDREFNSPVNRDFKLSGTFGELRTNHFHAGLDIKSENGMSGDPHATHGFVSRIRVEEFGYSSALYIEHLMVFTSVYAHLDKISPEIAAYVKQEQ
jgi:murein DD-endopeptidase MepM/ murein hydrolase activator NlpD